MGEGGYVTAMRWRGAPVRLHWSLPLSAFVLGHFRWNPAGWLGLLLVVLAHELGHGTLVRRYRMRVVRIDLHGMGGECRYQGYPTPWQSAVIAWGGVLAQALLLPVGFWLAPRLDSGFLGGVAASFGAPSLWMIAFNLLPMPPLDGSEAWKLGPMVLARLRRWRKGRTLGLRPRGRELAKRDARTLEELAKRDARLTDGVRVPDEIAEQVRRAVRGAPDEERSGD